MKEKWYDPEKVLPPTGVEIIAEIKAFNTCMKVTIKTNKGEGLAYIKRWRYLNKDGE